MLPRFQTVASSLAKFRNRKWLSSYLGKVEAWPPLEATLSRTARDIVTDKERANDRVVLNDRLGKKIRVKCKCVTTKPPRRVAPPPAPNFPPRWAPPTLAELNPLTVNPHSPTNSEDDTIGDLKKLVAAQTGTRPEKIRIQKWYNVYKDHITLEDTDPRRHGFGCTTTRGPRRDD